MNKKTINTILMSIIVLMSISICFLIFCITTRPRYVIVNEPEPAMITEASNLSEDLQRSGDAVPASDTSESAPPVEEESSAAASMHGKTSTRVNIRDGASQDAKVLKTVDEGTTFDILEIQDNGWTKIIYEGAEAYVSSNYVIVLNE